jgi:hypothetical protein
MNLAEFFESDAIALPRTYSGEGFEGAVALSTMETILVTC